MKTQVQAIKAAARRARDGRYPLLSAYELTTEERQSLMDGKSPAFEVVVGQGQRALKYQGVENEKV